MRKTLSIYSALPVLASSLLLASCATQEPYPDTQFAITNAAIEEAEESEAKTYATSELTSAKKYFSLARTAAGSEEHLEARRAAEKSEVMAKLAEAKAEATESRETARQMQESNTLMRSELERMLR